MIIVIVLALLLMALVIWVFHKRIEKIEEKNKGNHDLIVPL